MVEVSCSCGKKYRIKPELVGRQFQCKQCGNAFVAAVDPPLTNPNEITPLDPVTPVQDPVANPLGGGFDPIASEDLSSWEQAGQTDYNALAARQTAQGAGQGAVQSDNSRQLWQDRGCLVVTPESSMPPRCVRTNKPQTDRYVEFMNYIPVWLQIVTVIVVFCTGCTCGWLVLTILLMSGEMNPTAFKMKIEYGISSGHMTLRYISIGGGLTLIFMGLGFFISCFAVEGPGAGLLFLMAIPCFAAGGFIATFVARPVRCVYIDDLEQFMWLKGPGHEFLSTLPQFNPEEHKVTPPSVII